MPDFSWEELLAIRALAHEAGARILDIYNTAFEVTLKDDDSPVTAADVAADRVITEGLRVLTPKIPVLSEESDEVPFVERARWSKYWLLDPLDGTKEFVLRNGEFTVNIALIEHYVPVLGVVYAPVTGVCYFAAQGVGAFRAVHNETAQKIAVTALQPGAPIRVVGSRTHGGPALQAFVAQLPHCELLTIGSSLKCCLVAEGQADVYPRLGLTSEWDTAAAQAVLEVAGGQLISLEDGQPLRYNTKPSLQNPFFMAYGDARRPWLNDVPTEWRG